jgi:hypothetical protein
MDTVVEPKASPFRLSLRDFQPVSPPDALHSLAVHRPARPAQQRGDPPVTVATIGFGQLDDIGGSVASSSSVRGGLRCVDRCWRRTWQDSTNWA